MHYLRINKLAFVFLSLTVAFTGCSFLRESDEKAITASEIEKKWDTIKLTSVYAWVDYDKDLSTRSEVNFAKGYIEIETVVPLGIENLEKLGIEKISNQAEKVFQKENGMKTRVLKGHVKNISGEEVTAHNLKSFFEKQVIPKITKKIFTSRDGVKRAKMRSKIKMTVGHLGIRAKQYKSIVKETARKFGIEPHLVMAIIHQESYFNPLARSEDGALGLMQLIPRYGAKEAYSHIYKKNKLPEEDYLFNPANNVELGVAYYYLLKNKYFQDIGDYTKNCYVSLCAYNAGPTRLRSLIDPDAIKQMSAIELYDLLRTKIPDETKKYLARIVSLLKKYNDSPSD